MNYVLTLSYRCGPLASLPVITIDLGCKLHPFLVPQKLKLLINRKKNGRYAAIFPAHPPFWRGLV